MTIAEELEQVGQDAYGDRGSQAELVNLVFTIVSAHLSDPFTVKELQRNVDGVEMEVEREKQSWVALVDIGTGEEPKEYWMDGAACGKQVKWLVDNQKLPLRVKLVKNADKKGNPYWLKYAGDIHQAPDKED